MKYRDIRIGDKAELSHVITSDDINRFVELTGDNNKLHLDEKFAGNTYLKKPVVHGMLGASFISTVIGTKIPGDGALWYSQSLEFLIPVKTGDRITVIAEVVKKIDSENIVELKTEIYNQNRQIVTRGFAKVKVLEPEVKETKTVQYTEPEKQPKVAMIIGGTGVIGSAACMQLAKDGFDLIIHYHQNKRRASEIKDEVLKLKRKAIIIKADILNDAEIADVVSHGIRTFGKIDVAVNCAAVEIPNIKIQDLLWEDFKKQIDLHIRTTFTIIKNLLPGMVEQGYGKIINIGSLLVDKPNSDIAHYITAKAALSGLTKAMALELAPKGIRVNLITPSIIESELTVNIPQKVKLLAAAQTPLRRLAKGNDVAGVISFLACEKSDFLTGENIRVNGGQIMIS